MSATTKAVFLSYASQDAEAVLRIAEALRASGVEVWFDKDELVGGDAWDAKIRKQIAECALFVPVISANTQARTEGYFRLEWKLAAQRTHMIADDAAFLLPVVIDEMRDTDARVPAEFTRLQWTRLPGALATPQFVAQVQRLLGGPVLPKGEARPQFSEGKSAEVAVVPPRRARTWIGGGLAALVLVLVGAFFALRPSDVPRLAEAKTAAAAKPTVPAPEPPVPANDKSIAVLPFANMSAEKDAEFFADGVHEDLLTALAKVRDLKVISRTSVLGYRDTARRNLRQIAQELGVAHVLEGSVRRAGGKARITVQLIEARTDRHLWAETYDRDLADVFAVQSEVAREITSALKATLTPGEQQLIGRQLTRDQQAYDLYVNARMLQQALGERGSLADYERVIALFEQALARDPGFVLAYVQLAQIHSILYWFGTMDPSPARAAKMKAAVDAALRLAPDLPEVRMARGAYLYRFELDWGAALAEFRAAEAGLPNDAQLKFWLAVTNRRLGRWLESLDFLAQSVAVNPRDSSAVENWLGYLLTLRRYAAAVEAIARLTVTNPSFADPRQNAIEVQFALDGDRVACARALAALAAPGTEEARVSRALRIAFLQADLAAADRVLADTRATEVTEENSRVISDAVAYHRAIIAAARGDAAATRRFAAEAEQYYRVRTWNRRQEPWVRMRLAVCAALGGRGDEAVREANGAFADAQKQDVLAAVQLRDQIGITFLLTGRRAEALRVLREVMETPLGKSAASYRVDPLWSRLADDPRFEAILRSEKSL